MGNICSDAHDQAPMGQAQVPRKHLVVAITGAAGQIGSVLCHMIAQGALSKHPMTDVTLKLIDLPFAETALRGVAMELQDGSYARLRKVYATTDPEFGFEDTDFVLLVGARPRGPGMERADLLKANAAIFSEQGKILDRKAKKTTKVVVVGNPANTNCLICANNAPSLPRENFSALTRLDDNRCRGLIAEKTETSVSDIRGVAIWGNHSPTMVVDCQNVQIGSGSLSYRFGHLQTWADDELPALVQQRGKEVINTLGRSSAASAAKAICDHVKDLVDGTERGSVSNMGVLDDSETHGIPRNTVFSYPCVVDKSGEWKLAPNYQITDQIKDQIQTTLEELQSEADEAREFL